MDEEPYGYDHVFVHDRQTGETSLVSPRARLADGRLVHRAGYLCGWTLHRL